MFKLPPSDSPLRGLFELADLVPIMTGKESLPSLQQFTAQCIADIKFDGMAIAIFGLCTSYGVLPEDDKILLVRCELNSTEILWTFN